MSTPETRRGRPRSERAQQAILDAAVGLLLERGLDETSMDDIADKACVSKATIYRWWPTKATLALDALARDSQAAQAAVPDTGSLRADLQRLLRAWARLVRPRPYGRVISALITEAHSDPAFARRYLEAFVEPRRRRGRSVFLRAIERGEIPADTDVDLALDCLYGPIYHRLLDRHAPLGERFLLGVIDATLSGVATPRTPRRRRT
jgi:AcrR family transcriptional regulator